MLACRHEQLFEPWKKSSNEFFTAVSDEFASAAGWTYTDMREQLVRREAQWRDILDGRGSQANTEDYAELSESARAWIEILDEKAEVALAEEDAEDDGSDPDQMDNEDAPNAPMSMPQTKSVRKWPPTRPLSTP
jgi:hypothetical protein